MPAMHESSIFHNDGYVSICITDITVGYLSYFSLAMQETPKSTPLAAQGQASNTDGSECQIMLSYRIADCGAESLGQGGDGTVITIAKYLEKCGYTGK